MLGFKSIRLAGLAVVTLLALGACRQTPVDEPAADWTAQLTLERAAVGDLVTVTTPEGGAAETMVQFGGSQLTDLLVADDDLSLQFTVPGGRVGPVPVGLLHGEDALQEELEVLAPADVEELLLVVPPDMPLAELNVLLDRHGIEEVTELRQLHPSGAPVAGFSACLGQLALISVPADHPSIGELLAELEAEDQVWGADPKSEWGLSAATPTDLAAGAGLAQLRPDLNGNGVTIAVLDTGVSSAVSDLAGQLLPQIDVLGEAETGDPYVNSDGLPVGHGTAVASLAGLGLATEASILPIRVCDETGLCLASDVLHGVCSALAQVDPADGLVLNLSLGGDSEVRLLSLLLQDAAERGAVTVAAAGNDAAAPPHWPAAGSAHNPGLLAAGAVAVTGVNADFSQLPPDWDGPLELPGFGSLIADSSSGAVYADTGGLTLNGASLTIEPESQASALRVEVSLPPTVGTVPFTVSLGELSLEVDPATLYGAPVLQDGILIQALDSSFSALELLIDPLPAPVTFTASSTIPLTLIALELLTVSPAPGGYTAGDYVSMAAVGANLTAYDPAGVLRQDYTGTSFAAPQLAAAAALLLQEQADKDAAAVVAQLVAGAAEVVNGEPSLTGAGRLDLRSLYPSAP